MRTTTRRASVALLATALLLLVAPVGVSAHERRDVLGGHFQLVVGWLTEPAYDHQLNGLDLTVLDKTQKGADGKDLPVEDLDKTLKVEISSNGVTQALKLQPRFGFPGKYTAPVLPTRPGLYSFRISGTIGGQTINERFDSGPNTFEDVTALAALQFPPEGQITPPAVATAAPPTATPAGPASRSPATTAAPAPTVWPPTSPPTAIAAAPAAPQAAALPASAQAQLDAALAAGETARSQVRTARTTGIAGLIVGTAGLTAALLALLRRSPPARALEDERDDDE